MNVKRFIFISLALLFSQASKAAELSAFEFNALIKSSSIPLEKDENGYSGLWKCPLTNKVIRHSSNLTVANLISISFAKEHGGKLWPYATFQGFEEDSSNLFVVDSQSYRSRNGSPPTFWLPEFNQCAYLLQWNYVMSKYRLFYPLAQTFSYEKLLQQCDDSVNGQIEPDKLEEPDDVENKQESEDVGADEVSDK